MNISSSFVLKYSCKTTPKDKRAKVKWERGKIRERNAALDTHGYARAAAAALGYDGVALAEQ